MNYDEEFDLIISINSVITDHRSDIDVILSNTLHALRPGGKFLAILPSFDTVLHLRELWKQYYERTTADKEHVHRVLNSFDLTKKLDVKNLSYADDGQTSQCYHTPETIQKSIAEAGFRMVQPLQKIYYPWKLARRFDYGYFPEASEEIWDWFVVAEKPKA